MAQGKKLSKSDNTAAIEQEHRLLNKYLDLQIAWIREPNDATLEAYRKVSEEYRRQYDRG